MNLSQPSTFEMVAPHDLHCCTLSSSSSARRVARSCEQVGEYRVHSNLHTITTDSLTTDSRAPPPTPPPPPPPPPRGARRMTCRGDRARLRTISSSPPEMHAVAVAAWVQRAAAGVHGVAAWLQQAAPHPARRRAAEARPIRLLPNDTLSALRAGALGARRRRRAWFPVHDVGAAGRGARVQVRAGGGGGGRKLEALVHREIGGGQQREPFRRAQRCGTAGHEAGEARSALAQLLREPLPQAALATGVTAAT